ncbi:MAG: TRAP transporter substrate-binding protein [Hyphomicrobiaceae bacterium]|nr:TRAP transporter substrate-binding protein [Hyphomicrobiaceae bacterium]
MAAKKVIKVQSSQTSGEFTYKFLTTKWAPRIEAMSGGAIKLEILPTKAVVPHRETIDAVRSGILDGDLNAVAYFSGRDPVFALMGDLIAGYDTADQVQMFCMNGGGKEVLQKAYDKYGAGKIHVIGCGPYTKEALVAKTPIRGVAGLKGIKIRAPEGLAAEVFRRAGATSVAIPFSEVYTALEKGIVDAADASAYSNNASRGFHKIAQYPLYPGIHSMAILQFIINKDVWKKLTPGQQMLLETWYIAAYTDLRREADLLDRRLVAKDRAGKGTVKEVIDWAPEERAKFRAIAVAAWKDFAAKSPLAQAAYDAHVKFMKLYGLLK